MSRSCVSYISTNSFQDWDKLKITEDIKILAKLENLISTLIEIAEKQHSFSTLASTKLIQAKLALVQMKTREARIYLSEAQEIADKHNMHKLAHSISKEHDKLLEQLDQWKSTNMSKSTFSERIKLASVEEIDEDMSSEQAIESIKSTSEISILLLIMAEGGVLLFSHPFSEEWKFDNDLFSGFLNSFNSISDEIFSEGLDRAKFGQYTVLINKVNNFSVSYLFKGATYPAQQKIKKFSEGLKESTDLIASLNKYYITSQVLELKDVPSLESLIAEIFIN